MQGFRISRHVCRHVILDHGRSSLFGRLLCDWRTYPVKFNGRYTPLAVRIIQIVAGIVLRRKRSGIAGEFNGTRVRWTRIICNTTIWRLNACTCQRQQPDRPARLNRQSAKPINTPHKLLIYRVTPPYADTATDAVHVKQHAIWRCHHG